MTCDIKNDAVKSLAKLIRKVIFDSDVFGEKELKALVKKVSDIVETNNNDVDQAMAFARMVPQLVGFNMQLAPKLMKKIPGKPGFIYDLAHEFAQDNGLAAVEKYLSVGEKESSKKKREVEKDSKETEKVELSLNKRLAKIHRYEKVKMSTPPTFFASEEEMVDQDGNVIPDQLMNYNVLRNVLNKWNEAPLERKDSKRKFVLDKEKTGAVTLVAVTYGKLMETEEASMKDSDNFKPESVVLVVSDSKGNYLKFDEDGKLDDEGKVAYYGMYDYTKRGRDKSMLDFMSFSMYGSDYSRLTDKQQVAIDKEFNKQKKVVDFITKHLKNNPDTELNLDIVGGSYGRSPFANMSKFNFGKKKFSPVFDTRYSKVSRTPSYFVFDKQRYYFKSKDGLLPQDVETVMGLIFSPEVQKGKKALSVKQRREEINKITYVGFIKKDNVLYDRYDLRIEMDEDGEISMWARHKKGEEKINLSFGTLNRVTDEQVMKDMVRDYFTNLAFYNASKDLAEKADVNMPVLKELRTGNMELSYEKVDYLDWLRSERFLIDNPVGGKQPYFIFEPAVDTEDIIYEEDPNFADFKDELPAKLREQMDEVSYDEIPEEFKDAVEEAIDKKKDGKVIESTFFDGYTPSGSKFKYRFKASILKKGYQKKNIIDLVRDGLSTRMTLYENAYNILGKPSVGDYFYMGKPIKNDSGKKTGKYAGEVIVKITAVYGKADKRWDDNFYKEGWEDNVLDRMDKGHKAIEFEVLEIKPGKKKAIKIEDTKTPEPPKKPVGKKTRIEGLNERLDSYGSAKVVLSSDFNKGPRPKGRLNAFKTSIISVTDNLQILADLNLNEFDFISKEDKKRLDSLRPLAKELSKINRDDISSAERRTVAVEKRYAQLTNQLANEFVDIIGKYVEQELGKKISSSKTLVAPAAPVSEKKFEDFKRGNFFTFQLDNYQVDRVLRDQKTGEPISIEARNQNTGDVITISKEDYDAELAAPVAPAASVSGKKAKQGLEKSDFVDEFGELEKSYDVKGNEIKATPEQIQEARTWWESSPLSKLIPFKDMMDIVNIANPNAVAKWSSAGIVLFKGADFSDIYHEAWHGFSQTFLNQEQRDKLYTEVSKYEGEFTDYQGNRVRFDEASELQLEEYLAESFRNYVLSNGTTTDRQTKEKMNIFQWLYKVLKEFFQHVGLIDTVNPTEVFTVKSVFEKLRVGDISQFSHDMNKRSHGLPLELYHTIRPYTSKSGGRERFNYKDTKLVIDSIDSVFSAYVDNAIQVQGSNKYSVTAYKLDDNKMRMYRAAYRMFEKKYNDLKQQYKENKGNTSVQKEIKRKMDLIKDVLDNFGNLDSLSENTKLRSGVIYSHMMKSKILSSEDKENFLQDVKESQNSREASYDRTGQDLALTDLAASEVIYLLKSLNEFTGTRKKGFVKEKNELGIDKLASFDKIWNLLARNLENTLDIDLMYGKLQELAQKNGSIQQLLDKMGPMDTEDPLMQDLWTKFWQAFNKTRVPLIQMNLNERTGDVKYEITLGYAQGEYRKVQRSWRDNFESRITTYIKEKPIETLKKEKIVIHKNMLDVEAVLDDFEEAPSDATGIIEFFNALGMKLDDSIDVRQQINADSHFPSIASYIHQRLIELEKYDVAVESIDDIFAEHKISEKKVLKNLVNRFNDIAKLQAQYGDSVSNFMVSNAAGDTQFEHSLNNSMLVMSNTVNSVENEQALYEKGYMNHLDPERNPWTKRSVWRKSLFSKKGQRKTVDGNEVRLVVENVSGVRKLELNGNYDGVKTAETDPFTKLVLDFHTMLLRGTPDLMKHADKGSSYTAYVDNIITYEGKRESHKYIDDADFLMPQKRDISVGQYQFSRMLHEYLASELERMDTCRTLLKDMDQVFDYKYAERGSNFVVFEGILSDKTKGRLEKLLGKIKDIRESEDMFMDWLRDENVDLADTVNKEILGYLDSQLNEVSKFMEKAKYIDNRITQRIRLNFDEKKPDGMKSPKSADVEKAAVMSYITNSWIHNMESVIMLYGDLAMYNMKKEDFHKRNAGIASTGDLFRTDEVMLAFLENQVQDRYTDFAAKRLGTTLPSQNYIGQDGSMKTAVMADPQNIQTQYLTEYKSALESYFNERYKKDKGKRDAAVKRALGKYTEREEGDAQGWVSFDAYRKMLVAEGKWDWVVQEKLYNDIIDSLETGKDIDMEKVMKFFPVKKLQYWGPLQTEGLPMMAMHKFSLMPLIPNVIKGTGLEKLHDRMVRQGIAYATFKSGSKISTVTTNDVMDEFYSDVSKKEISMEDFTPNTIYIQFLKDQLETGEEFKGKITFPSQMRKLIIDSLVENGVPTDFKPEVTDPNKRMALWEKASDKEKRKSENYNLYRDFETLITELTETKYTELLDRIGWKIGKNGKPQGNQKDLLDYVVLNLELQDIAAHELDFLQIGPDGRIKNDLSMSFSAEKIERMLNALVVKEIIRQKVKGEGLIQVARTGWEKPSEADIARYGGDLPFYHRNPDGTTAAMKIKIAMQADFKGLLKLESVRERAESEDISRLEALNQLVKEEEWLKDNRKMITMTAVRIPTQGINSMEFMEVYEFLPEDAGNIIIMPSELVAKTGSDFDIDKMFTMMPHIFSKYGETRYVERGERISPEQRKKLINQRTELETTKREIENEYNEKLDNYPFDEDQKATLKEFNAPYYSRLRALDKKVSDLEALFAAREAGKTNEEETQLVDSELYDAYTERDNLLEEFYEKKGELLGSINKEIRDKVYGERNAALKPVIKKLVDVSYKLKSSSSHGTENAIITSIRNILQTESNFVNLIKPNDTDIFEDLSNEMAQYTLEYNPKEGREIISGTKPLEIMYNLYKLDSNNVGKQVLGIGAVENTYNVLFNRIGMYMNRTSGMTEEEYMQARKELKKVSEQFKYYTKDRVKGMSKPSSTKKELLAQMSSLRSKVKNFAVQKLMLKHNTLEKDGQTVISLSNMYDANNEHRISDVISQMINGWVDVARDTWIFNIGGNKELSPTILFMVQAGVPVKEAVYFAAQPLVREYVETQRLKKSTFSGPFGTEPEMASRFNYDSRLDMFVKYDLVEKKPTRSGMTYYDSTELYDKTKEMLRLHKDAFTEEAFKKRLDGFKKNGKITNQDKAVFLHFLEVEDMAKALTAFKVTTNPDTSRARTLYEAAAKEVAIMNLKSNGRIPSQMVDRVASDTAISSFFDALGYQQDIWGPNFKIRTNKGLVDELMNMLGGPQRNEFLDKSYQDPEKFANAYLNDFMVYMFQQKLYDFNLKTITSYKGVEGLSEKGKVTSVKYLPSGVVFDKGKFYVDKNKLTVDYDNIENIRSDYEFADVDGSMFPKEDNYYQFVFEREYLRSLYDFPYIEKTFLYEQRFEANMEKLGKKKTEDEIKLQSYEEVLRDMALKNTYNIKHMFEDKITNMAETLELIKSTFPDLVENYEVMQSLGKQRSNQIYNIKLFDRATDSESLSVYHENMLELMDPKTMRVNTSKENKEMIASFFNKLPFYSIIQSGFDTNTMLSMQRIMPYDSFITVMKEAMDPFTRAKNPVDLSSEMATYYSGAFMQVNRISTKKDPNPARGKYKDYNKVGEMTRDEFLEMDEEGQEEVEEAVMKTSVDYEGNSLFRLARREQEGAKAETFNSYLERIADDIRKNPMNVYVFNDVTVTKDSTLSQAKQHDWVLKKIKSDDRFSDIKDRIVGLPSRRFYTTSVSDSIVPDSGKKPDAVFMEKVDNAIDTLLQAKQNKMNIVFNTYGYGQVLIGASERGVIEQTKAKLAPMNFDYLSHQLLMHFGYVNKNYSNEEALKKVQDIVYTREDRLDKINFCFS